MKEKAERMNTEIMTKNADLQNTGAFYTALGRHVKRHPSFYFYLFTYISFTTNEALKIK